MLVLSNSGEQWAQPAEASEPMQLRKGPRHHNIIPLSTMAQLRQKKTHLDIQHKPSLKLAVHERADWRAGGTSSIEIIVPVGLFGFTRKTILSFQSQQPTDCQR